MDEKGCYLCDFEAERYQRDFDRNIYGVRCRRCGEYAITFECSFNPRSSDGRTLAAISAATRQASESGSTLLLRMDNWDQLAAAHMNTPVRQKVLKVLRYAAGKSEFPGAFLQIHEDFDYPAFDAKSPEECRFLVQHVVDCGYLGSMSDDALTLTVKGWDVVEPLGNTAGMLGRCFVAMSFTEELDEAYHLGIKPAVEHDCGLIAVRMKELHHNQDICDRLLSEIRQAQFVVADFTGHRNGVYYEAGFARALGREVINSCRDTDFDGLHFDTNHLNHIKWKTPSDLRRQLTDRIRATITTPLRSVVP